jgi:uncharacterized protein (DUF2126 family)/transglutaminase-like putative cysteine protease
MAIRVALHHQTSYRYDRLVSLSPHVVRLRPALHGRTPILAYSLKIKPEKHFINWQQDPFGNFLARLVFLEKTKELAIEVDLIAEMTVVNPFDFFLDESAEHVPFQYEPQLAKELGPYLEVRESGARLREWLAGVDRSPQATVAFLVGINDRLQQDIKYIIRMEPGVQTCEETLVLGKGSCRDSGWLLVQILRHLGFAARFVSGYLIQLTADVKALDGPSGTTADFTDLHAWTEVFVPGAGWIGLDPTSGLFAGEGHIPLACTPDPVSAAPVTGFSDEGATDFQFHMSVARIHEDPRVTKPYTEEQWQTIEALGRTVDEELTAGDVRLTMGGEPTFVSIDDMDGEEWTTAALGTQKRRLASELLYRLKRRFAPGSVLHFGQGKWYPGESLPRWAMYCFWRQDSVPVWRDPKLLANENTVHDYDIKHAFRFMHALAQRLGVSAEYVQPGYEDAVYHLWKESALPINIDPLRYNLDDPEERRRLARILDRGLGEVVGYALPLRWQGEGQEGGWQSSQWFFRRDHMFLIPGDSPMGYRLPLDSLPWVPIEARDLELEQSPFAPRPVLKDIHGEVAARYAQFSPEDRAHHDGIQEQIRESASAAETKPEDVLRATLCIEPREGYLYVFLPPVRFLEHYLDLIASVESTAAEFNWPIVIEGYTPPPDWRLRHFSVTPDPGVIEVNIHPARTWDEVVEQTTILYEEARLTRLGTEKFMLDGRHTGTGGGNHVTLGGSTPADSPFFRRPELLQSLLTYWQHHPSLSYVFSGLFVGPTSQAPRVDEARHENLYELEIAFQQAPPGETPAPWLVDRLFRNLLVDITGNTHRAEFCIDKLYSPENGSGRLGLVEMRAFEMPPHVHMSLVQMLLLRALVARFWRTPYRQALVRWGTELQDRFTLPHYLWQDLHAIICDLQTAGYPLQLEWFTPFLEFRFPRYGAVHVQDLRLDLRMALEPWHVLGEEASSGGTARYVDASVERLEIKVSGMTTPRYVVACNGRRIPLRSTGTCGESVAGVRYKAWQPPSGLHPLLPVHSPLVFDIVDVWTGRSIGGCTYHVSHPGGRHYDTFPVNANVAEARRSARFWPYGHTPGPMQPPVEEPSSEFPHILDLRRHYEC